MDHRALQQQLGAQPRVDHRGIRGDHLLPPVRPRRWLRRSRRAVSLQVLLDRPPVQPGLPGNLRDAHVPPPQRPEPAQLKPPLRLQHHQQPPVKINRSRPQASSCHAALPANTPQPLHVCPYLALHISPYADRPVSAGIGEEDISDDSRRSGSAAAAGAGAGDRAVPVLADPGGDQPAADGRAAGRAGARACLSAASGARRPRGAGVVSEHQPVEARLPGRRVRDAGPGAAAGQPQDPGRGAGAGRRAEAGEPGAHRRAGPADLAVCVRLGAVGPKASAKWRGVRFLMGG